MQIPTLLVAPMDGEDYDEDEGEIISSDEEEDDGQVLYRDGVWVAVDEDWDGEEIESDTQQSCYARFLTRFHSLRKTLAEKGSSPVNTNEEQPHSKRAWLDTIDACYPTASRISRLDDRALYLALQSCTQSLGHSASISHKKSCWIWTLLALVGDMGTLDFEKISKVRDLGSQAGRLVTRLRRNRSAAHYEDEAVEDQDIKTDMDNDSEPRDRDGAADEKHEESSENKSDTEMSMSDDDGNQSLEQARARLLAQLGDRLVQPVVEEEENVEVEREAPVETKTNGLEQGAVQTPSLTEAEWNTKATIDMILTVVGEYYGQKDLLDFREAW